MRVLSLFDTGSLSVPRFKIYIHEIVEPTFTIVGHTFHFTHLPPAGNHGLRFEIDGSTYALTGDAQCIEETTAFLQGVRYAVIDAGHLTQEQVIELALKGNPQYLVCSHIYSDFPIDTIANEARQRGFEGNVIIASDLMWLPFEQ
jgi:ribonuclease BN (tRNA processing enzyme)